MFDINCVDEFGVKRKCCGPVSLTEEEKDVIAALGFVQEEYFNHTNAGWFTKSQEHYRDESVVISRCIFLNRDTGRCGIYANRPQICKDFPRNELDEQTCGEGGYEGSGYNE